MGLVVFAVIAIYLIVSIAVVVSAARAAKKKGRSPWRWGAGAALIIYLVVFWDHIPTVVAHKYYCEKEAGFWVYKTVQQWKAENPGVAETLVFNKEAPHKFVGDRDNFTSIDFLNQRFNWVVKKNGPFLFNRWRREQQVMDAKTGAVLARYIDFSTGNGNIGGEPPARFWLQSEYCADGERNQSEIRQFRGDFVGEAK